MKLPETAFSSSGRIRRRWSKLLLALGLRYCSNCQNLLSLDQFSRRLAGYQSTCIHCQNERINLIFEGVPMKENSSRKLDKTHRLTSAEYESSKPRNGFYFCEQCKVHKIPSKMLTTDLCFDCAQKVFEDER